jgi:hypothetical protein
MLYNSVAQNTSHVWQNLASNPTPAQPKNTKSQPATNILPHISSSKSPLSATH